MPTRPRDAIDDEIRGLYQGPIGEFTPARQALLKRLQKAQDPRAAEIKELRKPTPSAWAVNLLFAREPDAIAALLATGVRAHGAVERALAKSDGAEVRAALETIRTEGARLAERAAELASAGGATVSATVLERLRGNLDALVLDPAHAGLAARGWLDVDLDAPGFDVLAALQLAAEKGRGRPEPAPARAAASATTGKAVSPVKPPPEAKPGKAEQARRAREDQERERRIAAARAELERLESAAEARRKEADSSASAAVEANAKAADAASKAELARRAAHDARRAADAAAGEVVRAREAVRRAENS
jgi:hypothetical protein